MGLFVFSQKKAKGGKAAAQKKGRGKKAASVDPSWDLARVRRAWHAGGLAVAGLTLVVGWVIVRNALLDYQRENHSLQTPPDAVALIDQPVWMSDSIADPMRLAAAEALSVDPFDGAGVQAAAQRLAQTPWIHSVEQVRRRADGRLEVKASYRTPVAAVRDTRNSVDHYLIDSQGVVLAGPWRWRTVRDQGFIVLEGVSDAPPTAGQAWPGEPIQHALALALLLGPEPFAYQIEAVHIENNRHTDAGIDLALYTTENRRVLWGAPLGHALTAELMNDQQKLENLRVLHRTYGHIDSVDGTVEVNHIQPVLTPGRL